MLNPNTEEYKITEYDVAEIFNLAYSQVANIDKAVSGFNAAGIYPLNPHKSTMEDFVPAQQIENVEGQSINLRTNNLDSSLEYEENIQPSTSGLIQTKRINSIEHLSPVPLLKKTKVSKSKPKEKSTVLTGKDVVILIGVIVWSIILKQIAREIRSHFLIDYIQFNKLLERLFPF